MFLKNYKKSLALIFMTVMFAPLFVVAEKEIVDSYQPLAPLPGLESVSSDQGLGEYIQVIFNLSIGLGAVLAVLMLVVGGFQYLSTDQFGTKSDAKDRIQNALMGLGLLLVSVIGLQTINPELLNLELDLEEATTTDTVATVQSAFQIKKAEFIQEMNEKREESGLPPLEEPIDESETGKNSTGSVEEGFCKNRKSCDVRRVETPEDPALIVYTLEHVERGMCMKYIGSTQEKANAVLETAWFYSSAENKGRVTVSDEIKRSYYVTYEPKEKTQTVDGTFVGGGVQTQKVFLCNY